MRILTSRYRISSMNPLPLPYRSFSRDNSPFLSATMFHRAENGRNLGKRLTIIPLTKRTRHVSSPFLVLLRIRRDAKKTSLPISDRACALFEVPSMFHDAFRGRSTVDTPALPRDTRFFGRGRIITKSIGSFALGEEVVASRFDEP